MTGVGVPEPDEGLRARTPPCGTRHGASWLLLVFGAALLVVWPLVAIAWSRVQVGDHTPARVLVDIALGIVVNATIFPLLR